MDPGLACWGRLRRGIPCIMWPAQEIMRIISKWLAMDPGLACGGKPRRGDTMYYVACSGNHENH